MAILRNDIVFREDYKGDFYIYKRGGKNILAAANPHSRKRVLKDKAFERTRKHASDMACAARLASTVYRELPPSRRFHSRYREMTGLAASFLYKGISKEDVEKRLREKYKR